MSDESFGAFFFISAMTIFGAYCIAGEKYEEWRQPSMGIALLKSAGWAAVLWAGLHATIVLVVAAAIYSTRLYKAGQKRTGCWIFGLTIGAILLRIAYVSYTGSRVENPAPQPAPVAASAPIPTTLPTPPGAPNAPRPDVLPATHEHPYTNSLGMRFVPVPGTEALFSIWDTRKRDYAAYAQSEKLAPGPWQNPAYHGVAIAPDDNCPVVQVTWKDAVAFCQWLTRKERADGKIGREAVYRLPTDTEWSWAVGIGGRERGATPKDKFLTVEGVYPWGSEWPPPVGSGNYADLALKEKFPSFTIIEGYRDGFPCTSPVGSFRPNPHGLYDMSGNVVQWCEDEYDPGLRVLRGSAWYTVLGRPSLLSSSRACLPPDRRNGDIGFRCVLVVGSPRKTEGAPSR